MEAPFTAPAPPRAIGAAIDPCRTRIAANAADQCLNSVRELLSLPEAQSVCPFVVMGTNKVSENDVTIDFFSHLTSLSLQKHFAYARPVISERVPIALSSNHGNGERPLQPVADGLEDATGDGADGDRIAGPKCRRENITRIHGPDANVRPCSKDQPWISMVNVLPGPVAGRCLSVAPATVCRAPGGSVASRRTCPAGVR